jgi:hypothetical protein
VSRLLVAGCGRSGTGFLAKVISDAGVPCGHEAVFNTSTPSSPLWGGRQAEASWLCLPWLSSLESDVSVLHLVRDPIRCASSFLGIGMLASEFHHGHRLYIEHVRRCAPGIFAQHSELGRVIAYWVIWNETIERAPSCGPTLRLEDLNAQDGAPLCPVLEELFGVPPDQTLDAYAAVPRNVNARRQGPTLEWDQLLVHAGRYMDRFQALAEGYGYGPTGPRA